MPGPYYISAQRGNDNNNGTSPSTPWLTIGKAVGLVVAGDTIYIGPGTYREKVILATAGASGNPISWIPDPSVKYVIGDNPGIVRVTSCGLDELPTSGTVWDFNAKNYNTLGSLDGRIYIDGSSDNYSVSPGNGTERKCLNVVAHGFAGFNYGANINCSAIGGTYGFNCGVNTNCIGIAYTSFNQGTNIHCIGIGGGYGFYGATITGITNTNCIAIGGSYGFRNGVNTNCIAIGNDWGFYGGAITMITSYCRAIACAWGFYGTGVGDPLNTLTASAVWCQVNQRGGGYETHTVGLAKAIIYDPIELIRAFLPLLQLNFDGGDNAVSVGDYDIMGHVRRLCSGIIDVGPYEHSKVSTDFVNYKTTAPGVRIEQKGMQKLIFWAKGGVQFTCKIWTKWANVNAAKKPQMVVTGKHVTRTDVTAIGSGVDWEQITVSTTPTADGEVELYLYARDEASGAIVYFSDYELTV